MKALPFLALGAALLAAPVAAEQRPVSSVPAGGTPRIALPSQSDSTLSTDMPPACRHGCFSWERGHRRFRGGFPGFIVVEREVPVIVEREVIVREAPPPASPVPLPEQARGGDKRKPYVLGASYASLPSGCMKLIEEGGKATYYYCGGEWYRQVGEGRSVMYRAVKREL